MNLYAKAYWSNNPIPVNQQINNPDFIINVPIGVIIGEGGDVKSVNGKIGVVVLDAGDVGAPALTYVNEQLDTKANSIAVTQTLSTKADLVGGVIPANQLPSFVDDVLEYASLAAFPATGEASKIYVALDTNKTYRWGGSSYVELQGGVTLGETAQTAYRGDRGKIAYDHSQSQGNPHNTAASEIILNGVSFANTNKVANGDNLSIVAGKLQGQVDLIVPSSWVNLRTLDSFFISTSVPNQSVNCKIEFQNRNGNVYMRGYFGTNGNLTNGSVVFFHRADAYYCEKDFSTIMGGGTAITKLLNVPVFGTSSTGALLTATLQVEQGSAALAVYNVSGRNLEANIVWNIPEFCVGKATI